VLAPHHEERVHVQRSIIAPAERVTNLRWGIVALIAISIFVLATARGVPAAAGLGAASLGFAWMLALVRLPVGWLIDRMGVARIGRISTAVWGLLMLIFPFLPGEAAAVDHLALGLAEGPAYPLAASATGAWFPTTERARAVALFDAAGKFGVAAAIIGIAPLVRTVGGPLALTLTGAVGIAFFIAFWLGYRNPQTDARLTHAERTHLERGGANLNATGSNLRALGRSPVWGTLFILAGLGYAFPTVAIAVSSAVGSTPLAAATWAGAGVIEFLVGGLFVDWLIARGMAQARVRIVVLVVGLILALGTGLVSPASDVTSATLILVLAFGGLGIASAVGWSLPALVAPDASGLVAGVAGAIGGVASILGATSAAGFAPFAIAIGIAIVAAIALLGHIAPEE
jgi:MFS transporter, ACS family, D-galactonate transporter